MLLLKKFINDLNIFIKILIIKKKKKYKIVPMGTYCLPRVITTIAKLKPTKKQGEKSLPFDLSFFNDFNKIIDLVDSNFKTLYDNIEFNETIKCWENRNINSIFIHDGSLTKEEFISRYNKRISNLYEYLSDKSSHVYILIASFEEILDAQLVKLRDIVLKFRNESEFDIIVINQSKNINNTDMKNIHIINQCENYDNFKELNKNNKWSRNIRKRNTKISQKIYYEIIYGIIDIIKNTTD